VNSLTGTANEDGSYTIHFGGEPGSVNHLPIAEGWHYIPAAKGDSRWNLEVPRGNPRGIKVTDHRMITTEPEREKLNNEDADNEEPLSSPRDYNVRYHDHRLFLGKNHIKE
jgi:hypothetical protein